MRDLTALGLVLALFGLAACKLPTEKAPADIATSPVGSAQAACNAQIGATWRAGGKEDIQLTAASFGDACDKAVAVLIVRQGDGTPVLTFSANAEDIFGLSDAVDATSMQAALLAWVDQGSSLFATTARLPQWLANADAPSGGEFPFYPEAEWDRANWEILRKDNVPVFCFPQGRESAACYALQGSGMEKLGVQTFPG